MPIPAQTRQQGKGWTRAQAHTWTSALLLVADKKFGIPPPIFMGFFKALIKIQLLQKGTEEHQCYEPRCTSPGEAKRDADGESPGKVPALSLEPASVGRHAV